jgi:hypothetical protein
MDLIKFPEHNVVFAANQPEYLPLPARRFAGDPQGRIAFCWKLTWRERLSVLFRGVLWHQVLTFNQPLQPQLLGVEKPEFGRMQTGVLPKSETATCSAQGCG